MGFSVSVGLHRLGSPAAEEAQHLVMIVALALLQETGVLDVKELAFMIEDYQDGEAEAGRMTKTLQQIRRLFRTDCSCLVAGIVVDMDIDIVAVENEGAFIPSSLRTFAMKTAKKEEKKQKKAPPSSQTGAPKEVFNFMMYSASHKSCCIQFGHDFFHAFCHAHISLFAGMLHAAHVLPHQRRIDVCSLGNLTHVEKREVVKERLLVIMVAELYIIRNEAPDHIVCPGISQTRHEIGLCLCHAVTNGIQSSSIYILATCPCF